MKLEIEGIFFNITKATYDIPIARLILNGENEIIFSKMRNKEKMSTLPILIHYSTRIPSQSNKTGERNTRD
jgi:hypothetical protein